jgi:hypothetical protein
MIEEVRTMLQAQLPVHVPRLVLVLLGDRFDSRKRPIRRPHPEQMGSGPTRHRRDLPSTTSETPGLPNVRTTLRGVAADTKEHTTAATGLDGSVNAAILFARASKRSVTRREPHRGTGRNETNAVGGTKAIFGCGRSKGQTRMPGTIVEDQNRRAAHAVSSRRRRTSGRNIAPNQESKIAA